MEISSICLQKNHPQSIYIAQQRSFQLIISCCKTQAGHNDILNPIATKSSEGDKWEGIESKRKRNTNSFHNLCTKKKDKRENSENGKFM